MALVACSECGHQISTSAAKCPSCGAKQTSKSVKSSYVFTPVGRTGWLLVGALAIAAVGGQLLKPSVPVKSELERLCDEKEINEEKFRKYWLSGKVDHAADVSRELAEINAKINAYLPEAVAKVCGVAVQAPAPQKTVAPASTTSTSTSSSTNGCVAPPFESLPMDKAKTVAEWTSLLSQSCRISITSLGASVLVQWQNKDYELVFAKVPSPDGSERAELKSIRSK